ncbi:hypothetical protein [Roseovarius rhodophyticola]|uniref:Uncharacterized protein n=1 Tax=Roseovarius rhodophyticola TaxID=3080827 RepID=A0ABZ2TIL3_9RHOB|nr:hypothetical protein [Roseovarius sp. W115]MDV2929866.1 hypothetical protein [Roseovarius sp. W115]
MKRFFLLGAAAFSLLSATALPLQAQSLAEDGLAPTIERLSADPNANTFELGMLQTLRAVEKTLQTRYEYGIGQSVPMLPVLRIQGALTPNPNPKPSDTGTLSDIMRQFVEDMEVARTTLTSGDDAPAFDLTLQDLWFDVDGNGQRARSENVTELLGALVIGGRAYREFSQSEAKDTPISVRFDAADHAWLAAYTHMLSGFGHLYLAFDPEPVFQKLEAERTALGNAPEIPNIYDQAQLEQELAALEAEEAEIKAETEALQESFNAKNDAYRTLYDEIREMPDGAEKDALQETADAMQTENRAMGRDLSDLRRSLQFIRNEKRAIEAKQPEAVGDMQRMAAQQAETIDFIYVLIRSLDQQPDADHIRAVRDNWMGMIAQNRVFWTRLAEETDNEREWIPNATQTSALPVEIPDGAPEAWQAILADIEAVLQGDLLITHPLLPPGHGISIPAYVEDPSPLSLLEWVHGIGAYRYAAKGPRLTAQSWNAFQRLTNGNPGGFAIFFN